MCEALRELMKDEIREEKQKAIDIALVAAVRSLMEKGGVSASEAMNLIGVPPTDQLRYAPII
ncbi:MAG: hypothetical protein IKG21_03095 [Atopobiaceae bacterium]|nr:hypothetical protein [Atopobiaceae bacterium]